MIIKKLTERQINLVNLCIKQGVKDVFTLPTISQDDPSTYLRANIAKRELEDLELISYCVEAGWLSAYEEEFPMPNSINLEQGFVTTNLAYKRYSGRDLQGIIRRAAASRVDRVLGCSRQDALVIVEMMPGR